jgi:hypothetical protein
MAETPRLEAKLNLKWSADPLYLLLSDWNEADHEHVNNHASELSFR